MQASCFGLDRYCSLVAFLLGLRWRSSAVEQALEERLAIGSNPIALTNAAA